MVEDTTLSAIEAESNFLILFSLPNIEVLVTG